MDRDSSDNPHPSVGPLTREELARHCKLSVCAVSLALNDHPRIAKRTRERVHETAQRLGFVANQAARRLINTRFNHHSKSFDQVALILFMPSEIALHEGILPFIGGAENRLSQLGANLLVTRVGNANDWHKINRLVHTGAVDGLALLGTIDDEVVTRIKSYRLPWIALGDVRSSSEIHSVTVDHEQAGRMALEYLAGLGHRHIGFIGGAPEMKYLYQQDIRRGFLGAAKRSGIRIPPESVYPQKGLPRGKEFSLLKQLLKLGVTAIFFAEVGHAEKFSPYLRQLTFRCKNQLDCVFCELRHPTWMKENWRVIYTPYEQVGIEGIDLLKELVNKPQTAPRQISIPPTLNT